MSGANGKDERKVRSLRDLPQGIAPSRDLWAGIESRIAGAAAQHGAGAEDAGAARDGRRTPRLRWLAVAATVAALAVGMWIGRSTLPVSHPDNHSGGGLSAGTGGSSGGSFEAGVSPGSANAARAMQAAYVSDPKFRRQREELVKSLESRLAELPPESRTKVLASLATLHQSMRDLEAALGKDPANALLQELLMNTYQDEMRVLTTVHEAGAAGQGI